MSPHCATLPDGRLHFSQGPIDLVIQADGELDAVNAAHAAAWTRFASILTELVAELPLLRAPVRAPVAEVCPLQGTVARRMWDACFPYRAGFITPMAAVAGAVADEVLACYRDPRIMRAAVNNGGDIAIHLSAHASYRIGVCTDIDAATRAAQRGELEPDGSMLIVAASPVRGVATSGWRGRSFSLGIADSVTVLADTAAQADAAATVIANAVDIDDARIMRRPANTIKDDSDLGDMPVTVDVPPLGTAAVMAALGRGHARARELQEAGLIRAAVLVCQANVLQLGEVRGAACAPPAGQGTDAGLALSY